MLSLEEIDFIMEVYFGSDIEEDASPDSGDSVISDTSIRCCSS